MKHANSVAGRTLRASTENDFGAILSVINSAAEAYRGVIPAHCWHEPYMSSDELTQEIQAGVAFQVALVESRIVGVMGVQDKADVALIRHAYICRTQQRGGVGTALLRRVASMTAKPLLVGTWADAVWALDFYRRNGFRLVPEREKDRLLRTWWNVPARQIEASVVLADGRWSAL